MQNKIHTMLAIGGSDPCGGAGIQSDILTARSLGIHSMTAITAVTAQNSKGVYNSGEIEPKLLKQQLDAISDECLIDGVKIGLMLSMPQIEIVSDFLQSFPSSIPIVVDPVLKATSAKKNFSTESDYKFFLRGLVEKLFPLATIITPNIQEAFRFVHELKGQSIIGSSIPEIGKILLKWWKCQSVIVKGGHLEEMEISDLLFLKSSHSIEIKSYDHPKLECHNLHGTGCVFSSLLTSFLILGHSIYDSFIMASQSMEKIIMKSISYRLKGSCVNGPLNIINYKLI